MHMFCYRQQLELANSQCQYAPWAKKFCQNCRRCVVTVLNVRFYHGIRHASTTARSHEVACAAADKRLRQPQGPGHRTKRPSDREVAKIWRPATCRERRFARCSRVGTAKESPHRNKTGIEWKSDRNLSKEWVMICRLMLECWMMDDDHGYPLPQQGPTPWPKLGPAAQSLSAPLQQPESKPQQYDQHIMWPYIA